MSGHKGWIGVDFDGTLAQYGTWVSASHCGEPVVPMVERVKRWLAEGHEVRVFTARIHPLDTLITADENMHELETLAVQLHCEPDRARSALMAARCIREWCRQHIGQALPITNVKDYAMIELWDDRCVQVRPNTGEQVGESTRGLT